MKPASFSPSRKESALKRYVAGEALLRKPTSGALDDCGALPPACPACARAPRAHAEATAKPSVAMKSRRLMSFPPRRELRSPCCGTGPLHASTVQCVRTSGLKFLSEAHDAGTGAKGSHWSCSGWRMEWVQARPRV